MPYATYRFNKIIAAETIRFIVTVAIVVYKGLKLVVYRMLTDFAQKTIIVKHTVGRIYNCELKSTERVHSSPKTKNSYREIPISKQLLQALKMVRKQSQSPYVVGTSTQSKEPRSYRDYFGRLLKRLDIPHLVFHGLRHTFATRCIESQCDYKTVSVILGHSNVATTLNLYVHPNLNQKKRCIDRMSNFLGIT